MDKLGRMNLIINGAARFGTADCDWASREQSWSNHGAIMERYALAQQIVTGHLCIMLRVACNSWRQRELRH